MAEYGCERPPSRLWNSLAFFCRTPTENPRSLECDVLDGPCSASYCLCHPGPKWAFARKAFALSDAVHCTDQLHPCWHPWSVNFKHPRPQKAAKGCSKRVSFSKNRKERSWRHCGQLNHQCIITIKIPPSLDNSYQKQLIGLNA